MQITYSARHITPLIYGSPEWVVEATFPDGDTQFICWASSGTWASRIAEALQTGIGDNQLHLVKTLSPETDATNYYIFTGLAEEIPRAFQNVTETLTGQRLIRRELMLNFSGFAGLCSE